MTLATTHALQAQIFNARPEGTQKPVLHGNEWMAITGKPLAATAGAMIFQKGGNAVDAACAMIAATCTMWDVLSWGGETQALIYNPKTKKVIGINALGVAPSGATPEFFKSKDMNYPPEYGPLAAVTPGTPGGICTMLAEFGTMSLKEVLAPAMKLAAGYPIEAQTANSIEREKETIKQWPYSKAVFLTHPGESREAPEAGEIFRQQDLLSTLTKMVDAEQKALKKGKSRKEAIYAAHERFYKGDIAQEFVRGSQEQGGLITAQDLATWKVKIEEPLKVDYKGIEVYKLSQWTQGPVMLQALNILENFDLRGMGFNSTKYIHTLYQAMNLAFADRDANFGDGADLSGLGELKRRHDFVLLLDEADAALFPAFIALGSARLAVRYRFEPGAVDDGMTVVHHLIVQPEPFAETDVRHESSPLLHRARNDPRRVTMNVARPTAASLPSARFSSASTVARSPAAGSTSASRSSC